MLHVAMEGHVTAVAMEMACPSVLQPSLPTAVPDVYHAYLAHHCPTNFAAHQHEIHLVCVCCTQHVVYMACWCLLQAAGARELRPPSIMQFGPLSFTDTAHQNGLRSARLPLVQPTESGLHKLLQLGLSTPHPTPCSHLPNLLSSGEPVIRSDSLASIASSASLGPPTPSSRRVSTDLSQGRQTAVRRYEPHLQPSQAPATSQTAEGMSYSGRGRGSTHPPNRGTHEAELARSSRQQRQHAQAFASPHIKPLVGEVMIVDDSNGNDSHKVFCDICRSRQWRFYIDPRGE